jgi:hypothetical protein
MNGSFTSKLVFAMLPLAWLCACAAMPGKELAAGTVPIIELPRTGVDACFFIGYFRHINALYPEDLRREFRSTAEAFSRDQSPVNRFRLILLLIVPTAEFRNDARALDLITDYLRYSSRSDDGLINLAFLLQSMLNERQSEALRRHQTEDRLKEQQKHEAALQQQLKKQVEAYQKLEQKLVEEQKHRALLEQQLEALKSIEQSLRRNKPPAPAAEAGSVPEGKAPGQGSPTGRPDKAQGAQVRPGAGDKGTGDKGAGDRGAGDTKGGVK